jgi:hypothetical protein
LTGKSKPVNPATEFKTHRHKKPQAEFRKIFVPHLRGSTMSRSRKNKKNTGITSVAKISIDTSA